MLGEESKRSLVHVFTNESRISYQANASNQLQLFGNFPAGCGVDPVNYIGNEQITPKLFPSRQERETEDLVQSQKLQMSVYCNRLQDEIDQTITTPNQTRVSTGLRLSYDDEERNSSVTSASGNAAAARTMLLSPSDNLWVVFDRQKEDIDRYIKIQEEQMCRGIKEMKERHGAAFAAAIETGIEKKLMEKDIEIENLNRKNRELMEKINHVAQEVHHWHYRAQYNESVANVLRANLQQVISQGLDQLKEGFGDSEIDDTASYNHPHYWNVQVPNHQELKQHLVCRVCKASAASTLLIPCKHLCMCRDCNMVINVCPVCHHEKSNSVQVLIT